MPARTAPTDPNEDPSTSGGERPATPPERPDAAEDQGALAQMASDVVAPVAPVSSAVRSDVSRLAAFLRSIHSGYLLGGLGLVVLTAVACVVIVLSRGFSDWYMHLAMNVILFAFVLLYVRAHQLGRRVTRSLYALVTLALLAFYAWILVDLVPARLDVLSDRPRPDGLTGPEVVLRPAAGELWVVVAGLGVVIVWLVAHWLVLGRFWVEGSRDGEAGRASTLATSEGHERVP